MPCFFGNYRRGLRKENIMNKYPIEEPFDCGCPACRKDTREWRRKKEQWEAAQNTKESTAHLTTPQGQNAQSSTSPVA